MPCSLQKDGFQWKAPADAVVTVKVNANATHLVSANYNDNDLPVNGNSNTTFTVVPGNNLLLLILAGPPDDVEVVEVCGGGQTQHMYGYQNDFRPALGFVIVGTAHAAAVPGKKAGRP
jgi:hypothetical protein